MLRRCAIRLLATAGAACIASAACGCCFRHHQIPNAVRFVDAKSGEEIREVLVIPVYMKRQGLLIVGVGGEHPLQGSKTTHSRKYLAHPFVYKTGDRFMPANPHDTGGALPLLPILVTIMWSEGFKEILVVAPGYRLAEKRGTQIVQPFASGSRESAEETKTLEPAEDPARQLKLVAEILGKKVLSKEERKRWKLLDDEYEMPEETGPVEVRLTSKEREMVEAYIRRGLQQLRKAGTSRPATASLGSRRVWASLGSGEFGVRP